MKNPIKVIKLVLYVGISFLILPMFVSAQYSNNYGGGSSYNSHISFGDTVSFFLKLIEKSIVILFSISVIILVWGIFKYVIADGEEYRKKGKSIMFYGIIGLFVMVSVWGLVALATNTLGLDNSNNSLYYYGGGGYGSGGGNGAGGNVGNGSGGSGFGDNNTSDGDYGSDYESPFDLPDMELFPDDLSLPDIDVSIE